jgi:hypothetical protein
MKFINDLEQSVVSISKDLQSSAEKLQSSSDRLKKYLDDRKNSLNNHYIDMLKDYGGETAVADYQTIAGEFRNNLDPRLKRPKTYDPNFDGGGDDNVVTTSVGFNQLPTSDNFSSDLRNSTLTGLKATKRPKWVMTFSLLLPPSATKEDRDRAKPIELFVNPSSWTRSVAKVQQNTWTRNGVKTERWGEDLEQIQASGSIGGFYTQETGLTRFNRWQTPNYTQFLNLVEIYRNNGCTYGRSYGSTIESAPSTNNRILDVGAIVIDYGEELFFGNFESFSITEDANNPFTLNYEFTFNCGGYSGYYPVYSVFDTSADSSKTFREEESAPLFSKASDSNEIRAGNLVGIESNNSNGNPIFTTPNFTTSEVPKDTLFPSMVSGMAKTDSTKPFIYEYGGSGNTRSSVKVDFRSAEEKIKFHQNLPSDPNSILSYINDFVEKQKNRSAG